MKSKRDHIYKLASLLHIDALFRSVNRGRFLIVAYHGVVAERLKMPCWWQIDYDRFRDQINFLKDHYTVLPLNEIISRINRGLELPNNTAAITFDDGYGNNFINAYPLLKKLQMPATVYLVTDFIGADELLWFDRLYVHFAETSMSSLDLRAHGLKIYPLNDRTQKSDALNEICEYLKIVKNEDRNNLISVIEHQLRTDIEQSTLYKHFRLLSWDQIDDMKGSGLISFGSHSSTHPILSRITDTELDYEIQASCSRIGGNSVLFAYPNGRAIDFDERCRTLLNQGNVSCAVSTISGLNDPLVDPLALRRISVGSDINMECFKLMCSGAIDFLKDESLKGQ